MLYTDRLNVDPFYRFCIGTHLKFSLIPRRCYLSGKYIWLQYGYRKVAMYTGPGDPVYEYRWFDKHEYLIAQLKGNL